MMLNAKSPGRDPRTFLIFWLQYAGVHNPRPQKKSIGLMRNLPKVAGGPYLKLEMRQTSMENSGPPLAHTGKVRILRNMRVAQRAGIR